MSKFLHPDPFPPPDPHPLSQSLNPHKNTMVTTPVPVGTSPETTEWHRCDSLSARHRKAGRFVLFWGFSLGILSPSPRLGC